jgi:hypothetical protein
MPARRCVQRRNDSFGPSKSGQPRIRKFQGEAGEGQNAETGREHDVLPALRKAHAQNRPRAGVISRSRFPQKQQRVVDEHRAHDNKDQRQINLSHPPVDFFRQVPLPGRGGGVHVDFAAHKHPVRTGVTLTAGGDEVVRVDRGVRIRGRQNFVVTVATGAIGDHGGTVLRGQAVIAFAVRLHPVRREIVSGIQGHRSVAPAAHVGNFNAEPPFNASILCSA